MENNVHENKSPWLHGLKRERGEHILTGAKYSDICVLGGGIAGVTTAYFLLKNTNKNIILIEGDKIAHGATGNNGGYAIADFEKEFADIVKENGLNLAREGLKELEEGRDEWEKISEMLNVNSISKKNSIEAFSSSEHFVGMLHEMNLKYGEIKYPFYLIENSSWLEAVPENFKSRINILSINDFKSMLRSEQIDINVYQGFFIQEMGIGNSATFSESLAKYCLENFTDRFSIYEKSFVNSVRLEQNGTIILDSLRGVAIVQELVLCTNGFENFDIYGPYSRRIDAKFHHMVSGLIGYMIGTFRKEKKGENIGGIFYGEEYKFSKSPISAGPYYYYTSRDFNYENSNGELVCIGGPEEHLEDRMIYKRDHAVDKSVYDNLKNFQNNVLNIKEEPTFFWHGLMGYTTTGVRVVGRDRRFNSLYYNLGCNGIGLLPSIAGAKRIGRIFSGEKLPPSIFDPR